MPDSIDPAINGTARGKVNETKSNHTSNEQACFNERTCFGSTDKMFLCHIRHTAPNIRVIIALRQVKASVKIQMCERVLCYSASIIGYFLVPSHSLRIISRRNYVYRVFFLALCDFRGLSVVRNFCFHFIF